MAGLWPLPTVLVWRHSISGTLINEEAGRGRRHPADVCLFISRVEKRYQFQCILNNFPRSVTTSSHFVLRGRILLVRCCSSNTIADPLYLTVAGVD